MVELFHVDLAAIFSVSPLSLSFFFFLLPSLLEDVLECTTQSYTVFPCGPSAAAVGSAALAGVSLQPTRESPLFSSLSHLTSHGSRWSSKIQSHFFYSRRKKDVLLQS